MLGFGTAVTAGPAPMWPWGPTTQVGAGPQLLRPVPFDLRLMCRRLERGLIAFDLDQPNLPQASLEREE